MAPSHPVHPYQEAEEIVSAIQPTTVDQGIAVATVMSNLAIAHAITTVREELRVIAAYLEDISRAD